MRHQAHDVAAFVADSRDVPDRAVRVLRVAKDDLALRLHLGEELGVGEPRPFAVLDRDRQLLPGLACSRKRRVGALDPQNDITTDERERRVRSEHAGQESGLAEDLKAVTDPEDEPSFRSELGQRLHRR
jgi:hypothetical protein